MTDPVKILLGQMVLRIASNKYAYTELKNWGGGGPICFKTFDNAAGNHAFDTNNITFGLATAHEGHMVRAAFQENRVDKDWLEKLIKLFVEDYEDESKSV